MSCEKEDYRSNMERVLEKFPNQEMISLNSVAEWVKIDKRNLMQDKNFPIKKVGGRYFVTVVGLSRWLS